MLAVLANETSATIQFRLTQFLCHISPKERAAVEVKIQMPGEQFHQTFKTYFIVSRISCFDQSEIKNKCN